MGIKGIIYMIKSKNSDKIYIGSTIHTLNVRLYRHFYDYRRYLTTRPTAYITSFELIKHGKENIIIELIEKNEFNNIRELREKEMEYINKFDNVLNKEKKQYKIYEKYLCECGMELSKATNKYKHIATRFHIDRMNKLMEN